VSRNVDFATFSKAVETARAANDPKVLAVRVKRPGRAPEFAVDANGHLVATVYDFAIEVPAPPQAARGGALTGPPAKIYLLSSPRAEVVIELQVTAATGNEPVKLQGRIVGFDPGRPQVFAIMDDEKRPTPLTMFTSNVVMRVFGTRLRGQPVDIPLGRVNLGNFVIASVSDPDPSGWMRLVLAPPAGGPRPASQPLEGQQTPITPVASR
jgi:hypothetical protein